MKSRKPQDEEVKVEAIDEEQTSSIEKKLSQAKNALKACQKERQEYLLGWQRAKADFINARRDEENKQSEFVRFAKEDILLQILPVIDNFEYAFSDKEAWERVDTNWREGVLYIYNQLQKVLEENGLVAIVPLGETFDPTQHESVESIKAESRKDDGKIIEVLQKGYVLGDKVVRPARVKVKTYK